MKKIVSLLVSSAVFAVTQAQTREERFVTCAAQAADKKGEERKEFMKSCLSPNGDKEEKMTPVENYRSPFYGGLLLCKLSMENARLTAQLGEVPSTPKQKEAADWRGCIRKHQADLKAAYAKFSKTVKKASAKAALKEHYVLATNALAGIEPASDERRLVYEKRQGDLKARVEEQWTRFEVESD